MNTQSPTKKLKQGSSQNIKNSSVEFEKSIQFQQQRLNRNKQRMAQLNEKVAKLKEQKAKKLHDIDQMQTQIRECKEHKQMLPLIQQLRQHYKKLKQQLGSRFYYPQDDVDVDQMSYEQLLQLGEKIGKVSKGITQQQFSKLERVMCSSVQHCSICQQNLTIGSQCIKLKCGHLYDIECLKGWFKMEKVCPLCKSESI